MSRRPSPLGIVFAIVMLGATAALSRAPYRAEPGDRALLRLSLRYQPEGEAACRRPTPEELADRPAHMRNPNECIRDPVPYRVRVQIDGATRIDEMVRAGGAREDRPVFVYRDVPLRAGERDIAVSFEALPPDPAAGGAVSLSWRESVRVEPREIVAIGYDRRAGALTRLRPPEESTPEQHPAPRNRP